MQCSTKINMKEERTADVLTKKTFEQLLIDPDIIERIKKCNFHLPTPVQVGAIPLLLLGNDLLVQAKSGTGKTLVFATLVANAVMETRSTDVVAVILAPVREIAYQIKDLLDRLTPPETRTCVFIGGEGVRDNKSEIAQGCSIAIGTPGRMAQLVRDGNLSLKQSQLFVLDEADKLMDSTFTEDIKVIYNALNPATTQVTAFSATYPNGLDEYLFGFMKSPTSFRLDSDDVQLLGIHQYALIALDKRPVDVIIKLLEKVTYAQLIVFANQADKCSQISDILAKNGLKVAAMSGNFTQEERKKVVNDLKNFALRIMVSTDLTARGIDALNVNLIFNIGVPSSLETYLHRIGRAGRYGGNGASITILTAYQDIVNFAGMVKSGNLNVKYLNFEKEVPYDLTYNQKFYTESSCFLESYNQPAHVAKTSTPSSTPTPPSVADRLNAMKNKSEEKTIIAETSAPSSKSTPPSVADRLNDLKGKSFGKTVVAKTLTSSTESNSPSVANRLNSLTNKSVEKTIGVETSTTSSESTPSSMADRLNALKNKSFGKNFGSFGKQPAPEPVHNSSDVEVIDFPSPSSSNEVDRITENIKILAVEESIKRYSRDDIISIKDFKTADQWAVYARSHSEWETKSIPFEFDSELRVPYEQQIRILRKREEENLRARQELLGIKKNKKELQEEKEQEIKRVLPSSVVGLTTTSSSLPWDECTELEKIYTLIAEYQKKSSKEKHSGPAVFPRASTTSSNLLKITRLLDVEDNEKYCNRKK